MENNKNYMKGFVPYAIAAAILSLCGGFTASVPTAISTAWDADSSLTFITLAYSLAAAAMAPILGKLGGVIGRRKMLLSAMGLYTVGQALIAICPQNIPLLLVFRFMVGIGAAGIAPVCLWSYPDHICNICLRLSVFCYDSSKFFCVYHVLLSPS